MSKVTIILNDGVYEVSRTSPAIDYDQFLAAANNAWALFSARYGESQ